MIFKILVFIGLYFLIKNMLKSAFMPASENQQTVDKSNSNHASQSDIIDAEFKVIKEE